MSTLFDIGEPVKRCAMCREIKPLANFKAKKALARNGRPIYMYCIPCQKKYHRERARRLNSLPESDPRRQKFKQMNRRSTLKKQYGIIPEEYDAILAQQNGVCAICKRPPSSSRYGRLYIDHNHNTGKIRSLLCLNCNSGLGLFQDSPEILAAAIAYLAQHAPPINGQAL